MAKTVPVGKAEVDDGSAGMSAAKAKGKAMAAKKPMASKAKAKPAMKAKGKK